MAQIARAILLANAIATSIFGYRSSMRPSQDPGGTGFRPIQAVKSRPRLNVVIGGAKASMAKAERGPIPGTVCSLLAIVVRIAKVLIASVLEPVRIAFERKAA